MCITIIPRPRRYTRRDRRPRTLHPTGSVQQFVSRMRGSSRVSSRSRDRHLLIARFLHPEDRFQSHSGRWGPLCGLSRRLYAIASLLFSWKLCSFRTWYAHLSSSASAATFEAPRTDHRTNPTILLRKANTVSTVGPRA